MYRQITRPALIRPLSEIEEGQIFILQNHLYVKGKEFKGMNTKNEFLCKVIGYRVDNLSAFVENSYNGTPVIDGGTEVETV